MVNNIYAYSSGSAAVHAVDAVSANSGSTYGDWYSNSSDISGTYSFSVSSNGNLVDDLNSFNTVKMATVIMIIVVGFIFDERFIDGGDPRYSTWMVVVQISAPLVLGL